MILLNENFSVISNETGDEDNLDEEIIFEYVDFIIKSMKMAGIIDDELEGKNLWNHLRGYGFSINYIDENYIDIQYNNNKYFFIIKNSCYDCLSDYDIYQVEQFDGENTAEKIWTGHNYDFLGFYDENYGYFRIQDMITLSPETESKMTKENAIDVGLGLLFRLIYLEKQNSDLNQRDDSVIPKSPEDVEIHYNGCDKIKVKCGKRTLEISLYGVDNYRITKYEVRGMKENSQTLQCMGGYLYPLNCYRHADYYPDDIDSYRENCGYFEEDF